MYPTNWLIKIASKEQYLFNKYKNLARKKWRNPYHNEENVNPMAEAQFADVTLKRVIADGMDFSRKFAEWYVVRVIKEFNFYQGHSYHKLGRMGNEFVHNVKDYLRNGSIPSLNTTIEEVGQLSKNWHEMIAAKEAEYKTHDVVAELSDGFSLVRVPAQDAKAEGYHMGHCSADYCEDIASEKSLLFSIRDPENKPHATFELLPHDNEGHFVIEQIKGKQNQAQPQYAKYIEEALNHFMKFPSEITFGTQGFNDYAGFQEDEKLLKQRIVQMHQQPSIIHQYEGLDHPMMDAYYYAQHGVGEAEVAEWIDTSAGIAWLEDKKRNAEQWLDWDDYLTYVFAEDNNSRYDLTDMLERYFIDDTDLDAEDSEMSEETWIDIKKSIEDHGNPDMFEMTSEMQDAVLDFAYDLWQQEYYISDYILEKHYADAEEALLEELDTKYDELGGFQHEYGRTPYQYYKIWAAEKRQEVEDAKWKKIRETVHSIMDRYNLMLLPGVDTTDLYRGFYFRAHEFKNEDSAAKWISDWVATQNREYQEHEANETLIENRIEQWKPRIEEMVPGYANLLYWDQRKLIVKFLNKETIDNDVVMAATELVRTRGRSWVGPSQQPTDYLRDVQSPPTIASFQ